MKDEDFSKLWEYFAYIFSKVKDMPKDYKPKFKLKEK